MVRQGLPLVGLIALGLPVTATGGEPVREHKLRYRVAPAPATLAEFYALGKMGLQERARPEDVKHPEYESDNPVFVQVPVPGSDRVRWAVLDTVASGAETETDGDSEPGPSLGLYSSVWMGDISEQAPIPDRLYFDSDGDNDLTDERPLGGRPVVSDSDATVPRYMVFPATAIGAVLEGKRLPYHIRIAAPRRYPMRLLRSFSGAIEVPAYAVSSCYYEGRIRLGGRAVRVAVLDANSDGRFDARGYLPEGGAYPTRGDTLIVSERAGRPIRPYKAGADERQMLGRYLAFGGEYYQIQVAPGGTPVGVYAEKAKVGVIAASQADADVRLANADGVLDLRVDTEGVRVPAGSYHMLSCALRRTDGDDREWALACRPASSEATTVEVTAGATAPIPAGPPLLWSLAVDTEQRVAVGGTVAPGGEGTAPAVGLSLRLAAQGGMRVTGITVNGKRPSEPKLRIKDATGKVVHEAAFHYG
ncbi:MAG: hypothetical protein ACE5R4_00105 [Armatimonadota bacterium]